MSMNIAINGAAGRMGHMLLDLVNDADDLVLSGAYDYAEHPDLGKDALALMGKAPSGVALSTIPQQPQADAVIDFSLPVGFDALLDSLEKSPLPLVVGTTGLTDEQKQRLSTYAKTVPVVFAPNFSTGVNLLFALVKQSLEVMGNTTEVEIVEAHHHHKKDAPSGTAAKLLEVAADALGLDATDDAVHGRFGDTGERPLKQIGVHAMRGGEVVGEHTVFLFGNGERVELTHKAQSRSAFAVGALAAARWVMTQAPGLYDMQQVLGLKG